MNQIIERKRDLDFPWFPARVVCHDILGQTALVDLAGLRDAIAAKGGNPAQVNPVVPTQLVVDHSLAVEHGGDDKDAFAKNRAIEDRRNEDRFHFINWTKTAFKNVDVIPQGNGILHQINLERMSPVIQARDGVAFPDTLVGTDSHTPMVDALGVIAVGVGGLEAESVMLGRASYMRLPDIIGVEITGKPQPGITATDIVLALTEYLRAQKVVSSYLEFFGEGTKHLTLGDRATISNMTPEYGATAAMFYIDRQTIDYLTLTGREDDQVKLVEEYAKHTGLWADDLETAQYERVLSFDLSSVGRNIAGPSNPHSRVSTADLASKGISGVVENEEGKMPDGAVIIAAITSCTNTSNPRNMIAAGLIARNANKLGLLRKPWVKSSLAPGSKAVQLYLEEAGLLPELENLGFGVVAFACTSCNGMSGALDPKIAEEIKARDLYATAVLSGNRNFDGRIHPHANQAFLASPPLVVAYALAGTMHFDLYKTPLGKDQSGKDVFLKDIWPSNKEIEDIMLKSINAEMFIDRYSNVSEGPKEWSAIKTVDSSIYNWEDNSTYVKRPPFFDNLPDQPEGFKPIKDARLLLLLADSVTTDHISPAGNIKKDSPTGDYFMKNQVQQKDFNSYGARRGNHEVMMRGTFGNIKIRNEMAPGTEGGFTTLQPDGKVMSVYDAAIEYKKRGNDLVVMAGKEYGTGSSRDWAAKGTKLLGIKAVIAESFERIHRSNLIGMGVLPLQFKKGFDRKKLNITGSELITVVDIDKGVKPRDEVSCEIKYKDGTSKTIKVLCRIDTQNEVEYYKNGGILQYVLRNMLN